jgi:hypothetical protein
MKTKKVIIAVSMLAVILSSWVACKKDSDPGITPKVTLTNPINNATNVPVNGKISVKFNEVMEPSTFTSDTYVLTQGTTPVVGTISVVDSIATFTPSASFAANTLYTATVKTGVKDKAGKNPSSNYVWSFTTGAIPDTTKPTVTGSDPVANATGIELNRTVNITFSEAMDLTSLSATNFSLLQGTTAVAGAVSSTSTKITFTPTANLEGSKIYTAILTVGAKDLAGNNLAANYTFSFTTVPPADVTPPLVSLSDPLNNATGVATNKAIAISFNEPMDPLTINSTTVTLKQGTTAVAGTVTYAAKVATFTPSASLGVGLAYTATVSTGAKDVAGNALAAALVLNFTTSANITPLAVVNLGSASNYVILAKTAISNVSTSAVTGDLGLSPAAESYITGLSLTDATGYATSAQVTGKIYAADQASPTPVNLTTAVNDMITAYTDAAGRPVPDFLELSTGNIGGKTLAAGLYKWTTSVTVPTDVTISGGANDVWIFQISGDLSISNTVKILLSGGAQAKNIFWQVAGSVSAGTTSHVEGIILSQTSIILKTGASMNGRALAQTAVILDGNAVTKPQ